jgi:hypothetical protein
MFASMGSCFLQTHLENRYAGHCFIEDKDVIKKILKHLGLLEVKRKPRPKANAQPFIPESYPTPSVDDYVIDPDTPVEAYFKQSAHQEINGKALPKTPVIL